MLVSELRLQEVEKWSCMINHGLGVLPQPPAHTCCSALITLFMWIGAQQVGSVHTAFSQQWKWNGNYWCFGIFEGMCKMGSSKSHNQAQTSKESHLFWIVGAFSCSGGGLFVLDHHSWQYLGSPLWAGDEKARGETINSDAYIKTFKKLKQHYRWLQPHRNARDVWIQHDNAHPHTSLRTQGAIAKFGWNVLSHPPFSHHLAPSDFLFFGPLNNTLHGTRFEDDKSLIHAVRTWLREQETSSYRDSIHALISRWHKAVDVDGNYVEK